MGKRKRIIGKSFSVFMLFIMVACSVCPLLGSKTVIAASKPQLVYNDMEIPMGKNGYAVIVDNKVKKATYSYVSSNKKIVTVDKKGNLTGIKAGKTKVTVYQKYKKKKTKVGTCTVTIKSAVIPYYITESPIEVPLGKEYFKGVPTNLSEFVYIDYQNSQATYTYYSRNKEIAQVTKAGLVEAYKTGVADITIKETYKKKTRTVGTFQIEVKAPELGVKDQTVEYVLNNTYAMDIGIYYAPYYLYVPDQTVEAKDVPLEFVYDEETGDWTGCIKAIKEGSIKINVYANSIPIDEKSDYSQYYIGSFTAKIVTESATEMNFEFDELYNSEYNEKNQTITMQSGGVDQCTILLEPEKCSDEVTVASSDPTVVEVLPVKYDEYFLGDRIPYFMFVGVKPGTATITVTAGSIKKEVKVTVVVATVTINEGGVLDCLIQAKGQDSKVTVTSSNPDVIEIGKIYSFIAEDNIIESFISYTTKAKGEAVITISCDGNVKNYYLKVIK